MKTQWFDSAGIEAELFPPVSRKSLPLAHLYEEVDVHMLPELCASGRISLNSHCKSSSLIAVVCVEENRNHGYKKEIVTDAIW